MSSILLLLANALWVYEILIIIRCIMSFVDPDPSNPLVRFVYNLTDPLMDAVRRSLPFLMMGGLDLSPIVLIFLIEMTRKYLVSFAL